VSVLIGLVACDDKKCGKCTPTPKVYEELRCVGILDSDGCCFERFDCPDLNALDSSKCHYKGRSYNISENVMDSDSPPCSQACHCSGGYDGSKPSFRCASVDCPENFGFEPEPGCMLQYSLDKCCHASKICGEDKVKELAKCELEGRTYTEGEKMYPDSASCHTCLCTKDFNNSISIDSNKNCKKKWTVALNYEIFIDYKVDVYQFTSEVATVALLISDVHHPKMKLCHLKDELI